jgi:hypothetical protein
MFKLLSRLFSSTSATEAKPKGTFSQEELEELARRGLFKPQYVIPIQLEGHPILRLVQDNGMFDLNSSDNHLMLPTDPELARRMNLPRYAETPLPAYLDGARTQLDRIWATAEANGANSGDKDALQRAAKEVVDLQYTLKVALINGDVYVAE